MANKLVQTNQISNNLFDKIYQHRIRKTGTNCKCNFDFLCYSTVLFRRSIYAGLCVGQVNKGPSQATNNVIKGL